MNFNSWVGRVAKADINLAEADINNDTAILNGTKLAIQMLDDQSDAIVGASAGNYFTELSAFMVEKPLVNL